MSFFMNSVMDGMIGIEPLLGQIPVRKTGHSGPTRNVPGSQPVDHPLTTFQETFSIHADVIRNTDVESFLVTIYDLAEKHANSMGKTLVQTLNDVTKTVGNLVNAGDRPLSWDLFLDALEMIDFSFDENGRPHAKQILMNPSTANLLRTIKITPEQQQRHDEIIRRKKELWDAQKRTRRLPRPNQGTGV